MNPFEIIDKYYPGEGELRNILVIHSGSVADKAIHIARLHPELKADEEFLFEAAMLHDVGIFLTDAPGIHCLGEYPYIAHGYLGADLLRKEGFPRHAAVCEHHTGAGLSLADIVHRDLPIPHREMLPETLEEEIVCFADKFFSKTQLDVEKSLERARRSVAKFGDEGLARFDGWAKRFL